MKYYVYFVNHLIIKIIAYNFVIDILSVSFVMKTHKHAELKLYKFRRLVARELINETVYYNELFSP